MATLVQAVRLALHYGESHLGVTDIFGEDVGPPLGGVFTATQGLKTAWNSPLDERGIIGEVFGYEQRVASSALHDGDPGRIRSDFSCGNILRSVYVLTPWWKWNERQLEETVGS